MSEQLTPALSLIEQFFIKSPLRLGGHSCRGKLWDVNELIRNSIQQIVIPPHPFEMHRQYSAERPHAEVKLKKILHL
jgi:hypothetical protein